MTDCMNTSIRIRPLTSPMTKMCLLNVHGGGAGLVSISHHCFVFASPHFLSISQASTIAFKTMCMTVPHPWYQHHPCCSCLIQKTQENARAEIPGVYQQFWHKTTPRYGSGST